MNTSRAGGEGGGGAGGGGEGSDGGIGDGEDESDGGSDRARAGADARARDAAAAAEPCLRRAGAGCLCRVGVCFHFTAGCRAGLDRRCADFGLDRAGADRFARVGVSSLDLEGDGFRTGAEGRSLRRAPSALVRAGCAGAVNAVSNCLRRGAGGALAGRS